jgi:hypothetical protein
VCLGRDAFFCSRAGQNLRTVTGGEYLLADCIGLAFNFHCSPLAFADLPMSQVQELIRELISVKDKQ